MFVVSLTKNNLKKSIAIGAVVIILSFSFVAFLKFFDGIKKINTNAENSLTVATERDLLTFISGYGWQVDDEPVEVREVIIPETFDDVYNKYNEIQLEQGFDLEPYAGTRVKRWTYIIRNYPETSPSDDFIRINILVSENTIIGGDVCSVKLDGFMHGFYIETDIK